MLEKIKEAVLRRCGNEILVLLRGGVPARLPSSRHKIRGCSKGSRGRARVRNAEQAGTRFFLFALLALTSCASGLTKVLREVPPGLSVGAVLITPVRILGVEAPLWRQLELSQRQLQVGLSERGDRLAFFGPTEIAITRWEEPGWLGNTGLQKLIAEGIVADRAVLIRTTAEQRISASTHERENAKGRSQMGAVTQETTWLLTLELSHPSSRAIIGELSAKVTLDPFAPPTGQEEFDPAPQMTSLLESMTKGALLIFERWEAPQQPVPPPGYALALSPAFLPPDEGATPDDALQAELWRFARARFLSPWLSEVEAAKVATTPRGLVVINAAADAAVVPGDVIVAVDGQPAMPEIFARKRLRGLPVEVRVSQSGNERDAVLR